MNNQKKERQVNDYVLLFSAGAALGTIFLWGASYIFPEGEIVEFKIEDFSVLCSNCHRMVHRKNPPYTIEELKAKFKS